jgi:glycosyltransferase involved in cell wall biosynthesis
MGKRQRRTMKIAVYTIALNEEQFVERWYNSAKDADYLLIADTGSTDKTIELAKSFGINVVSISINPWRFENARNASLNSLPEDIDICIALDMDEILVKGWREHLEQIKPETTRPRYQYTWSWNGDKPGLQYGADKIHTRHGYRWKHPVHEVLVANGVREVQEWIDLEIHHHPDQTKSRGQYLPLLELAVQEDPTNDRNQYYLAREYFFNADHSKAKDMFIKHLENPDSKWGPERAASCRYLAKCDTGSTEDWLLKANLEAPGRRESAVELSQYYYKQENWEDCLKWAKTALLVEKKPLDYLCEDFAWGSLPHDLAAIASWNLGMFEEAFKYGTDALYLEPSNPRLLKNIEFYFQSLDK